MPGNERIRTKVTQRVVGFKPKAVRRHRINQWHDQLCHTDCTRIGQGDGLTRFGQKLKRGLIQKRKGRCKGAIGVDGKMPIVAFDPDIVVLHNRTRQID